jgi:hypothetical protein
MTMTLLFMFLAFVVGFGLCWSAKDKITVLVTGTESFIRALEARATALKAAL